VMRAKWEKNGVTGNSCKRRLQHRQSGTWEFGAGAVAAKQQTHFGVLMKKTFNPKGMSVFFHFWTLLVRRGQVLVSRICGGIAVRVAFGASRA
jgi:hypothetical protein